ncbi:hypothetical protein VSPL_15220 [Vibrio splendidus]|nr:hypothetical protein VSPL_15220 [Vibrio splendidus]
MIVAGMPPVFMFSKGSDIPCLQVCCHMSSVKRNCTAERCLGAYFELTLQKYNMLGYLPLLSQI